MKRIFLSIPLLLLTTVLLFSCNFNSGDGGKAEECRVTLDTLCAETTRTFTVKYGELIEWPDPPTKEGYSFLYWSYNGGIWSFSTTPVTEDVTITAFYLPNEYTISYDLSGGRFSAGKEARSVYTIEDGDYTPPTPILGNLKFDGWLLDGEIITSISSGTYGDITLKAIFYEEKAQVLDEGSAANAYTVGDGNDIRLSAYGKSDDLISVRIEVPEDWHYVKLALNGNDQYYTAKAINNLKVVDVKMSANNEAKISVVTKTDDPGLNSGFGVTLSDGTVVDKNYFPGFVRKSVTFTLDDGLYVHDKRVIDILKPRGFTGTFNINNPKTVEDASIYEGFEVANHHLLHTTAMRDGWTYNFSDSPLPAAELQDKNVQYRNYNVKAEDGGWIEGFYYVHYSYYGSTAGWHPLATDETYIEYLEKTTVELEKIFGENSVVGFAYPHGGSANAAIREYIKNAGYLYARKTGNLKGTTGFALPTDRYAWTYNADHNCLLSVMADFDSYEDDGELKMFAFGVHAKDFETYGKWDDLEEYARLYGNRQEDFWYATNRQIFEYEDALKMLEITDEKITNPSDIDLFVTINGVKTIIFANSEYAIH